jgi:hypothetical protein
LDSGSKTSGNAAITMQLNPEPQDGIVSLEFWSPPSEDVGMPIILAQGSADAGCGTSETKAVATNAASAKMAVIRFQPGLFMAVAD